MKQIYILAAALMALTSCSGSSEKKAADEAETASPAATEFTYDREINVIEYDSATLGETLRPDAELPVVIDFNATWCGPCQMFKPVFEKVAEEYDGAIFLSVDVDNNPAVADQFEVNSIPQVTVLMPDGTTRSTVGYMDEAAFREFLGI